MLLSHRHVLAPTLGASLATSAIVHRHFRLHAVENHAVTSEDALMLRAFERAGHLGRPSVTLLLDGAARLTAHGRTVWIAPGEALAMDSKAALVMRQEGPRYAALALEWDDATLGDRPAPWTHLAPTASLTHHAATLFALLRAEPRSGPSPAIADALNALLDTLRSLGLPVWRMPARWLDEATDATEAELLAALDRVLSAMESQPMVCDLAEAIDRSPRQLQRMVTAFHATYGFNAGTWQDTRSRRRVMLGAALMTAPKATVSAVSAVMGYQSETAFARALVQAGLPPPREVRAAVEALRDPPTAR